MKLMTAFIVGFIVIVVGMSLLGETANTTRPLTNALTVTNESFTGVNATAVALTNGNHTSLAVRNSTHDTLTITTHYTTNATAGTVTVLTGNGTYYADYTYEANTYQDSSATRSVISLIVVLFGIAVFALLLAAMYPVIMEKFGR